MPESLSSRIYKARYFLNCGFLDELEGNSPPFFWKSIHKAIKVLSKGVRCRVGDARAIEVHNDSWISDNDNFLFINSTPIEGCEHLEVNGLIHSNNGALDTDMVEGLLTP
ncbi:hypothetical protein ES332_D07G195000v1 [Gossypium tomentosum]|uniref:Uncharacterized protein n=1 Tax=Gossypium tomentosum TaxID=34277 RepID=A0A5D2K8G9_GOSTO|nr:hypothetical protein ES332_D07G195000v1 [Gossypium tomentosum]